MGALSSGRIVQTDGPHRSKCQRVPTALRQRLNRHTAFKIALQLFVRAGQFDLGGGQQRVDKRLVFRLVERAVEIVAFVGCLRCRLYPNGYDGMRSSGRYSRS